MPGFDAKLCGDPLEGVGPSLLCSHPTLFCGEEWLVGIVAQVLEVSYHAVVRANGLGEELAGACVAPGL